MIILKKKKYFIIGIVLLVSIFGLWIWKTDGQYNYNNQKKKVKGVETKTIASKNNKNFIKTNKNFFPIAISSINYIPFKKKNFQELKIPSAHAGAIIDVDSGKILWEKNGSQRRQIASLTKIMTAIVVINKISHLEKEVVTIGDEIYIEGTKIGCPRSGYCNSPRLKKGEKIYALDLLKAMLMNSANDAATALGKHIGGSIEGFALLMNQKVEELGLKNTHFCTPSGLEIDGKEKEGYSSAIDLARIASYSMKYPLIWNIFRIPNAEIYSVDKKFSHKIFNTDRLLNQMAGCLGGKTGFTPLAGRSLMVGAIDRTNKHRIILVLLDDPYRWQDIQSMAEWTWNNYEWK